MSDRADGRNGPRLPDWARAGRRGWRHTGLRRPAFAEEPGTDRESVWDYPRPPRLEPEAREISVALAGDVLARTTRGARVVETASPPTYYFPPDDVDWALLAPTDRRSRCEWKGEAVAFDVVHPTVRIAGAAWSYRDPFPEFAALSGWVAFYPEPLVCRVGAMTVRRQPGRYYGGWVTDDLAGPFKGEPGSEAW